MRIIFLNQQIMLDGTRGTNGILMAFAASTANKLQAGAPPRRAAPRRACCGRRPGALRHAAAAAGTGALGGERPSSAAAVAWPRVGRGGAAAHPRLRPGPAPTWMERGARVDGVLPAP